jgi:hypothetical protein
VVVIEGKLPDTFEAVNVGIQPVEDVTSNSKTGVSHGPEVTTYV